MRFSRFLCVSIWFVGIIIVACDEQMENPTNFATAKRDGQEWSTQVNAQYGVHFGDSSMIITLSVPAIDGISKEHLTFFYLPLKNSEFSLIDSIQYRDSVNIICSYVLLNSHGDVIQVRLYPSKEFENKLILESFDEVTKELIISFSVLFETRYPEPYPNWKASFTEGKIRTIIDY